MSALLKTILGAAVLAGIRLLVICLGLGLSSGLLAGFPTTQEALAHAFPGAQITRKEHWLTELQAQKAKDLAGTPLSGLWQVAYEARKDQVWVGVAFLDTHRVRTLQETVLVAVEPKGHILRVEVLAFREPQDYIAKDAWRGQFQGKQLDPQLTLKGGIRPLSGSTLTANAMTDAARRVLALQQILYGEAK